MSLALILPLILIGSSSLLAQSAGAPSASSTSESISPSQQQAQSTQINQTQLSGLPLNGRSYSQLATLQAGVSDPSAANSARGTSGGGLTVSGGRRTSNSFLLDGTNIMNTENEVPRSAAGVQLGSDAINEVQVFSINYSAEYGRGSGGVLNSITSSGTPQFHGKLFEFFRNEKLDTRNYFDNEAPPPFKRNQFGFTLTGPVIKDRTFFMGSFEGMRDRLTSTETDFFPDKNARLGILDNNTCVFPNTDQAGKSYCVHPNIRPYLNGEAVFPFPNFASLGGGIGENHGPQYLPTDENFFTFRLDHQISLHDSFFVRYTFDDASSFSGAPAAVFRTSVESRQQYLTFVHSHIFSTALVNAFRFGYTRPTESNASVEDIAISPSLRFVPGAAQFGQFNVPGLTGYGPLQTNPEVNQMRSFQFSNDVVWQRGRHALRFGFQAHRYAWDVFTSWQLAGIWSFNSMESFLKGGDSGTQVQVALPGSSNKKN